MKPADALGAANLGATVRDRDPLRRKPVFEMHDILRTERVGETAQISRIRVELTGVHVPFEDTAMDCHVAFAQA